MKNRLSEMQNAARIRHQSGSSISEFGPAVLVLFMLIFFPMLDLITLGVSYGSCATLNQVQAREASLLLKSQATDPRGAIKSEIPAVWSKQGLGRFVNAVQPPTTEVQYIDGTSSEKVVRVTTRLSVRPMLYVPLLNGIPGVGAPASFTISTERILENSNNFNG